MGRRNDQRGSLSFYGLHLLFGDGFQAAGVVRDLVDNSELVQLIKSFTSPAPA
jgi:hypothetical protein